MAITASLYLNQSSVGPGTPVNVIVTVSNSGASDVSITSLRPTVLGVGLGTAGTPLGAAVNVGEPRPSVPATVPAGGSAAFSFGLSPFASSREGEAQALYDVSAAIYCDDGSVVSPQAATVSVSSPFDLPPEGGLRFDSNLHSGLVALL